MSSSSFRYPEFMRGKEKSILERIKFAEDSKKKKKKEPECSKDASGPWAVQDGVIVFSGKPVNEILEDL